MLRNTCTLTAYLSAGLVQQAVSREVMRKTASSAFYRAKVMLLVPAKQYTHNRVLCSSSSMSKNCSNAVIAATPQLENPIELFEVEEQHGSILRDAWRGCVEGSVGEFFNSEHAGSDE